MRTRITIGFVSALALSACVKPQPTERPVLEALKPPVETLGGCVARRQWDCTTSATRDIVSIMDAAGQ
jgi:hypothetical protein